ncbi:MAG: hypothetical protein U5O16_16400 [Rhodococcus sp. (in: high G+C Gram-positive bacteria)]|uniref:hypothetical protein n=1 Tax=Rhodococcus sp. TaxID=1831 RepID=UPI002ADBAF94|nr:hypothetical protein [Rhodococcus sp. (in: high G+C Gram-positive bacteria)]
MDTVAESVVVTRADLVSSLAKNKTSPLRETDVGGDEKKHAQRWRESRAWT